MRIEVAELSKHYGRKPAVEGLSFSLEPGKVTGFLGPNGSGKSTTLQLMLGLLGGGGDTLFDGRPYRALPCPMREVGAVLEARAFHPRRSARDHIWMLGAAVGASRRSVDKVLGQVGLADVADRPAGEFSLGMGQRLGLAGALLGQPRALLLDEPANGLDPHGVAWLRTLLREFAADGHTVFASSHLLAEMELLADHVIVIGRGRLIADESMDSFLRRGRGHYVLVRSPEAAELAELLVSGGAWVERAGDREIRVVDADAEKVGEIAHRHHIRIHQLTTVQASLEEAFLKLTGEELEYAGQQPERVSGAGR